MKGHRYFNHKVVVRVSLSVDWLRKSGLHIGNGIDLVQSLPDFPFIRIRKLWPAACFGLVAHIQFPSTTRSRPALIIPLYTQCLIAATWCVLRNISFNCFNSPSKGLKKVIFHPRIPLRIKNVYFQIHWILTKGTDACNVKVQRNNEVCGITFEQSEFKSNASSWRAHKNGSGPQSPFWGWLGDPSQFASQDCNDTLAFLIYSSSKVAPIWKPVSNVSDHALNNRPECLLWPILPRLLKAWKIVGNFLVSTRNVHDTIAHLRRILLFPVI